MIQDVMKSASDLLPKWLRSKCVVEAVKRYRSMGSKSNLRRKNNTQNEQKNCTTKTTNNIYNKAMLTTEKNVNNKRTRKLINANNLYNFDISKMIKKSHPDGSPNGSKLTKHNWCRVAGSFAQQHTVGSLIM